MLIFKREIEDKIKEKMFDKRVILLFGPRQAGKTTLSKTILTSYEEDAESAYLNCELSHIRDLLVIGKPDLLYNAKGKNHKVLVLDEAQTIEHIGLILKNFIDTYPDVQIIATGSSSFDLANRVGEPLTGRSYEFMLYPLSFSELKKSISKNFDLNRALRFGMYPAIVDSGDEKAEIRLRNLSVNYLYKDIFTFENIRKPKLVESLLKLLALQIGSQVSFNELAQNLNTNKITIERYIDLLEKTFIIKRVYSYAKNYRNELKKSFKVYFLDLGIRNLLVNKLMDVEHNEDKGHLFENFFIIERMKFHHNKESYPNFYFWRTYEQHEVDLIEEKNGKLDVFECKWKSEDKKNLNLFQKKYPNSKIYNINKDNLNSFL